MAISLGARLKHAWNAFTARDPTAGFGETGYYYRPDRMRFSGGNERSIVTSVYNRIAIDAAAMKMRHVRVDSEGYFLSEIDSKLNRCLSEEANLDQTGRAFIQDMVMSMLDEGCVAIIPVDTDGDDPRYGGSYDILSLRTGKILEWRPSSIKARVYNDRTGKREDITVSKSMAAIVENPLYAITNEPNSTMQRLIRKLNLLDTVDEQSSSGKLDLLIQLPYLVKTEARKAQAEKRRLDIENQLAGSKYGIAYIDGTERVTQLNRPIENNLLTQIEYLTNLLHSQLGITQSVMDGTADEKTMLNYYNRTIEPLLAAAADEMRRTFLTRTARSQGQSIMFFRDPFRLVPIGELAEASDKFTRNEILSSNEVRQRIGLKPSDDPNADKLKNKNIGGSAQEEQTEEKEEESNDEQAGDS